MPVGHRGPSEPPPLSPQEWAAVLPQGRPRIDKSTLSVRPVGPDGVVLAQDVVNLGSSEGVFQGLRFRVFEYRGGPLGESRVRVNKGMVEIVEVLGPHGSRVRVLSQEEPIVRGDLLANPLFSADEPVHVWLHETLDGARIAQALRRVRAVVDAEIDEYTDLIVVPDADHRQRMQARRFAVRMISVTDLRLFVDY